MNPLIIKKMVQGLTAVFSNKYVIIGILTFVVFFTLKGGVKKFLKARREKQFNEDEIIDAHQIAQQYRGATNPSGNSWFIDIDGTDEVSIDRLAYQTKGHFEQISNQYKLGFDETLTERMRIELDPDEFQAWYNIIT